MMKKIKKNENGMLIVEATFVFPIMFLVVFLMYFLGNAYFQKSKVDSIVTRMAYYGASQCADPLLKHVQSAGSMPDNVTYEIQPYRYLMGELGSKGGMNSIETDIKNQISNEINAIHTGIFGGMKPRLNSVKAEFENAFVYSTFYVQINYTIPFPIKLFGMKNYFSMKASTMCEVPVSDTPEFIRNVDMVGDFIERSEKATEAVNKISEVMDKIDPYIN